MIRDRLRQLLLNENEFLDFTFFSNKRVLDVGCGYGTLSYRLARKFPSSHFMGMDVSIARINEARNKYKLPNLEFFVADAYDFNVKSKFDIILAIDLFHHVPFDKHSRILQNISNHLVGSGIFILRDINKNSSLAFLSTLHDIFVNKCYPNGRLFSEWREILNKFNFEIDRIVHFNKFVYPCLYIISRKTLKTD